MDQEVAHDAAGRVLNLLHVGFHHQGARRDHGSRKVSGCADHAHAADQENGGRADRNEVRPDRLLRLAGSAHDDLLPRATFSPAANRRLPELLENLLPGAERLYPALVEHQHVIDRGHRAWPVGDHDRDAAAGANPADGVAQCLLAVCVEIGIGLVEYHQERVVIERARQRDALTLPAGKHGAAFSDLGLVTLRQPQDDLMHAGLRRRRDQLGRIGILLEPGDVLRHRALEQLHFLRQVADEAPERIRAPLIERRPVEPDRAARRFPDADQGACQRGLARTARADHAERVAGDEREADLVQRRRPGARRDHGDGRQPDVLLGRGQRDPLLLDRRGDEGLGQPPPALPRGDEGFPVRDRELDWRQRSRRQNRGRQHHARGRLLVDHEIGADAQNPRLNDDAKHARKTAEPGRHVVGGLLRLQIILARLCPSFGHARPHAERLQQGCVATSGIGQFLRARSQA